MKNIFLIALLVLSSVLHAQDPYKSVVIPLQFPEIGDGLNPYNICSNAMRAFDEKSIKAVFNSNVDSDNYCELLNLKIVNTSSMFKNKLKLELVDCTNRTVWTGEGVGRSKDYPNGYYEAIVDAIQNLDGLPVNENSSVKSYVEQQAKKTAVETPPAEKVEPVVKKAPAEKVAKSEKTVKNSALIFFNNRFSVDVVDSENDRKELRVVNDNGFVYQKNQVLALLIPTGIDNIFTVSWTTEDGSKQEGVANFSETELKISLKGTESEVISLQKYTGK